MGSVAYRKGRWATGGPQKEQSDENACCEVRLISISEVFSTSTQTARDELGQVQRNEHKRRTSNHFLGRRKLYRQCPPALEHEQEAVLPGRSRTTRRNAICSTRNQQTQISAAGTSATRSSRHRKTYQQKHFFTNIPLLEPHLSRQGHARKIRNAPFFRTETDYAYCCCAVYKPARNKRTLIDRSIDRFIIENFYNAPIPHLTQKKKLPSN